MVPADVSVTVAVQLVPWCTTTEDGVQATLVEVVRGATVKVKAVLVVLAAWVASPPCKKEYHNSRCSTVENHIVVTHSHAPFQRRRRPVCPYLLGVQSG